MVLHPKLFPDYCRERRKNWMFSQKKKTLEVRPITVGRNAKERVDKVATFTGQTFQISKNAVSLLTFDESYEVLLPDVAWIFGLNTNRIPAKGLSQGAISEYGKGRIAVFRLPTSNCLLPAAFCLFPISHILIIRMVDHSAIRMVDRLAIGMVDRLALEWSTD
jgi:hypothetical protein